MRDEKLSLQPIRGTSDWLPDEFLVRKYIFDTWRKVCISFGYEEYLTPLMELSDIYKAKSGEDVGGKELMSFVDKAGRELSIRPEMTPSVTRMVCSIYPKSTKPLRLFSIANFFRNEKPQRGRNREFWQLNFDVFGSDSLMVDIEVLQMSVEIMLAFNPPVGAFEVRINSRKLINRVLQIIKVKEEDVVEIIRLLDKYDKLSKSDFITEIEKFSINKSNIKKLIKFLNSKNIIEVTKLFPSLENDDDLNEVRDVINLLYDYGYSKYIVFSPKLMRGFDYYDGIVFEVFDKNPSNLRSLFGGGRYNGLSGIFDVPIFPAVGAAPGDEPTYLFLQSLGLLDSLKDTLKQKRIYIPILDKGFIVDVKNVSKKLRQVVSVEEGVEVQNISKALTYANKKKFNYIIIIGENEIKSSEITIKNLNTSTQDVISVKDLDSYKFN